MLPPLGNFFKLSADQSPSNKDEETYIDKVPYTSAMGSIMYAMVGSMRNIAHVVSLVSRFMAKPGIAHWKALKWIHGYIRGSHQLGLNFCKHKKTYEVLRGFVESNYAGSINTKKSLGGFIFTLLGTTIKWKANLQSVIALSTTEAELVYCHDRGR